MPANLNNKALWRVRTAIDFCDDKYIVIDGKRLINYSGNDYLALANHPSVKSAFAKAALQYGLGSASSPLFSGYTSAHQALEEAFAQFLGRDRALLFNSGYHANLAIMTSFANRSATIIADKHCHASLLDGIALSRAKLVRYQHQNLPDAERLLNRHTDTTKLLVTESVFSMEGNITDAASLARIAKNHQALLVIDDAHGIGVIGNTGKGIAEYAGLNQQDLPCLVTPLGKAPGSMGAIVSGSVELIEALIQQARTYRYSTALPPAIAAATLTSLAILDTETWRREKLHALIRLFNQEALARELKLSSTDSTPIRCILIGDNAKTLALYEHLRTKGYLVSCARPPSVGEGTARLRISLNCMHEDEDIIRLLDELVGVV